MARVVNIFLLIVASSIFIADRVKGENKLFQSVADDGKGDCCLVASPKGHFNYEAQMRGGHLDKPRNYNSMVTVQEKNDIRFIVTTLANKPPLSLAFSRTELESAGDRINHVHPLRFLHTIFVDEELKVSIKNMQSRGWGIWNNFMSGLKTSLYTEYEQKNILCHADTFAQDVGIASHIIMPALQSQQWDKLVDLLIRYIPRKGSSSRYD